MKALSNFGNESFVRAISLEKHNEIIEWLGNDLYKELYTHFYLGSFDDEGNRFYVYIDFLVDSFNWDRDRFMLLLLKILDSKQHNIIEAYRKCDASEEFFEYLYSERLLQIVSESADDLSDFFNIWVCSKKIKEVTGPNPGWFLHDPSYQFVDPYNYINNVIQRNYLSLMKIPSEYFTEPHWHK